MKIKQCLIFSFPIAFILAPGSLIHAWVTQ